MQYHDGDQKMLVEEVEERRCDQCERSLPRRDGMALQSHAVMQRTKISLYSAGPSDLRRKDGEERNLMQRRRYLSHYIMAEKFLL